MSGGAQSQRRPYNQGVSKRPYAKPAESLWARLAAFLGFLAVLSALAAPVSMLAQDVRAGQLSGICGITAVHAGNGGPSSGDAPQAGAHCEMCGALGWALPPMAMAAIPSFAGHHVLVQNFVSAHAATVIGLPFSRAPPSLQA